MRTVVLTQVVPNPPDAGPKIKTHYVLRTLAQEHDVELITFTRTEEEQAAAHELRRWCTRVVTVPLQRRKWLEPYYAARGWMSQTPFLVSRDARAEYTSAVHDRLSAGDVDVLHADQLPMAQYLSVAAGTGASTIFDAHNAVWELVRGLTPQQPTPAHRAAAEVEWRLLRRYEGRISRTSDATLVVSEQDRRALNEAAGASCRTQVVPIGVEVAEQPPINFRPNSSRILSVATMHYPPNAEGIRWFRDRVWPLIKAMNTSLGVDIVGTRPARDLVEWGEGDPRVTVHGYVAELSSLFEESAVFIVPLQAGSGMRVKIIEAMARGVPVVSTSVGADGLDVVPGMHLLIADEPKEFAQAIMGLARSPEWRHAIVRAARQRVLERYDWRECCQPVLDVYRTLGSPVEPDRLFERLTGLRRSV